MLRATYNVTPLNAFQFPWSSWHWNSRRRSLLTLFIHLFSFSSFLDFLHFFISFISFISSISSTVFHSLIPSFVPSFIFLHSRNGHWSVSHSSTCSFLSQLKTPSKIVLQIFDYPQMAGMHVAYAVCIEAKTFLRLQKPSCCCACCANRDLLADKPFDFTLVCGAASHSGTQNSY